MAVIEVEGKTVDEAIEIACRELKAPREKLEIEVLSAGSTGIFGIVGTRKAKVKATLKEETSPVALEIQGITEKILELMGLEGLVTVKQEGHNLTVSVGGDKNGLLIGRQGQTIDSLQYLLSRIITRLTPEKMKVVVDSGGYRERQEKALTALALRLAEKAKKTGKPAVMASLNAHDRRIVHLALEKDKGLKTSSRGEGAMKKIVITAVGKKETAPEPPSEEG